MVFAIGVVGQLLALPSRPVDRSKSVTNCRQDLMDMSKNTINQVHLTSSHFSEQCQTPSSRHEFIRKYTLSAEDLPGKHLHPPLRVKIYNGGLPLAWCYLFLAQIWVEMSIFD
eukprot:gene25939-biopygen11982